MPPLTVTPRWKTSVPDRSCPCATIVPGELALEKFVTVPPLSVSTALLSAAASVPSLMNASLVESGKIVIPAGVAFGGNVEAVIVP